MSVTAPGGFEAAGIACGIKDGGVPDLALVATADRRPVAAAGVFTTNLATAAPVQVSREHLGDGKAAAVVLNSGNANAATGERGRHDARRMCEQTARELGCAPEDVLVCSTGLIGYPLPMEVIEAGIPELVAALGPDEAAGRAAADAILTTDTVRKQARVALPLDGATATVAGMAKGAAMLSPAMATMLAVLTTDAAVEPRDLHAALEGSLVASFNALTVDGATSTNDTVVVLARGSGPPLRGRDLHGFTDALGAVCVDLAAQMAADAEGATKQVRVIVRGARSGAEARRAARAVANSQLVQCSLNGADPYWGRVLSELGASGSFIDPELVEIAYNGVVACRDGVAAVVDSEELERAMAARAIDITCDLKLGMGEACVVTTDLSHAYIDENRQTS